MTKLLSIYYTYESRESKLSAKTSKQKSPRMGALIMHRCTTNHSEMQWLKTTKNVISHCFCGFSYRHDSVECLWLKISHEFMLICQLEYLFYLKAQLWKRVLENNFPSLFLCFQTSFSSFVYGISKWLAATFLLSATFQI